MKTIVLCFNCTHQRKKQHPSALKCHANRNALHHMPTQTCRHRYSVSVSEQAKSVGIRSIGKWYRYWFHPNYGVAENAEAENAGPMMSSSRDQKCSTGICCRLKMWDRKLWDQKCRCGKCGTENAGRGIQSNGFHICACMTDASSRPHYMRVFGVVFFPFKSRGEIGGPTLSSPAFSTPAFFSPVFSGFAFSHTEKVMLVGLWSLWSLIGPTDSVFSFSVKRRLPIVHLLAYVPLPPCSRVCFTSPRDLAAYRHHCYTVAPDSGKLSPVWPGHPSFTPLSNVHLLSHLLPFLLFPFFHWLYLFSSFVHPFPFYQNTLTPFPGRRS